MRERSERNVSSIYIYIRECIITCIDIGIDLLPRRPNHFQSDETASSSFNLVLDGLVGILGGLSRSGGTVGQSGGGLGAHLERSGAVLGGLGAVLGDLGPSGGGLERLWRGYWRS